MYEKLAAHGPDDPQPARPDTHRLRTGIDAARCCSPASAAATRVGNGARPLRRSARFELRVEGPARAARRGRQRDAPRDDVAAVADREGSGAAAVDALAHGPAAGTGHERHRLPVHHRRQPRSQAAGTASGVDGRSGARHRHGGHRAAAGAESTNRVRRRSAEEAAHRRRLHRLHLGQVPAHGRREVACPAADDQERRARDGRGHRVCRVARGRRVKGGALRRRRRIQTRLDDVDHRGRGRARGGDRPDGHRPAERRAVVRASLARLRRVVECGGRLHRARHHGLDGHARSSGR